MTAETYVVSVYRRGNEPGKEVAGLIERAGSGERKAFASGEELWKFLCNQKTRTPLKRGRKPQGE